MRQKRIKVNGKEISYYESRENGHPVVLVHGMSSSSSIFIRQLIDSVLSYKFRFIALDLIGYGKSDYSKNPEKDYSLSGLSDFLVAFSNKLDISNAVFVGHNVGANIILEACDRLVDPKGIVLLGAVPFSNPINNQMFLTGNFPELFSKAGIDDSEVHQLAAFFVEKETNYPDFIPEIIRKADIKTRVHLFDSIKKGQFKDQLEIIKNFSIPVAVYHGEYDQIINFDYLNSIQIPTLWRRLIQIIRDVGHIFFYESPADFNISLETYLNSIYLNN